MQERIFLVNASRMIRETIMVPARQVRRARGPGWVRTQEDAQALKERNKISSTKGAPTKVEVKKMVKVNNTDCYMMIQEPFIIY